MSKQRKLALDGERAAELRQLAASVESEKLFDGSDKGMLVSRALQDFAALLDDKPAKQGAKNKAVEKWRFRQLSALHWLSQNALWRKHHKWPSASAAAVASITGWRAPPRTKGSTAEYSWALHTFQDADANAREYMVRALLIGGIPNHRLDFIAAKFGARKK